MCDASGIILGTLLGQQRENLFHLIYYTSKSLNDAQCNYMVTDQELLAVFYAFENFRAYWLGTKVIVHMENSSLIYLIAKKEDKPFFIRWILLLLEFNFEVKDQKGCENQVADPLSCLKANHDKLGEIEIYDTFPNELVLSILGNVAPWYVDYTNYIVSGVLPEDLNHY